MAAAARRFTAFEWACLAVVAAAAAVRATYYFEPEIIWDSAWYLLLGRSFAETGTFLVPWTQTPTYSGYWPPLFPFFVAPFVSIFGPSFSTLVLASSTAWALLVAFIFFATRDLLGRTKAFAAMAAVAAQPAFLLSDEAGMSESLLALAVAATVYAYLRSLTDRRWLVPALLFAALAYLGKANLGLPFVAGAAVAFLAWRLLRKDRRPTDVVLAVVGLLSIAAAGLLRTGKLGGLGLGVIHPVRQAIGEPLWVPVFLFKVVFVAAFLLVVTLPFSLRARAAWRAPRTERTDALWLATVLPLVAGAVFTTSFYFVEQRELVDFDNIRYLTPGIVPFLWLMLHAWDPDATPRPTTVTQGRGLLRTHERVFAASVGALLLLILLNPLAAVSRHDPRAIGRLFALLVLALVPLGLALATRATHVELTERRTGGVTEPRYVRAAPVPLGRGVLLVGGVAILGVFLSSWYFAAGLGLLVALANASPRAQATTMALTLLAATIPGFHSDPHAEDAAEGLLAHAAGIDVVHTMEPAVYFAAVRPETGPRLLAVEGPTPPPEAVAWLQLGAHPPPAGFTQAAAWQYETRFTFPLQARLWIEANVLGLPFEAPPSPSYTLYLRDAPAPTP